MQGNELRQTLLSVVEKYSRSSPSSFQSQSILQEAAELLHIERNLQAEQALLTYWHDLLRSGYIAWGYDLSNQNPPHCHLTENGRQLLAHFSRDPMNPDGYLSYLKSKVTLDSVALLYIEEALKTYSASCYRAAAVMVGCAAETLVVKLRDTLVANLNQSGQPITSGLNDWHIKRVIEAIGAELTNKKSQMAQTLREAFEAHWSSFVGQIRMARNDAGHPSNTVATSYETAYAALLIFPELAKLAGELEQFIHVAYPK